MCRQSFRRLSWLLCSLALVGIATHLYAQGTPVLQNDSGLRLLVALENTAPTLRIVLPGHADSDRAIEVIFPEHVTVRKHGSEEGEHLYMFQPGLAGSRPDWKRTGQSLQYEKDFPSGIHMLARATLGEDGVLFHFDFVNRSNVAYDLIWAPIDPRLTSILHDARLERTYVHHSDGFDLLASETPARLTMPLTEWLPARYLDSYTWPIPAKKVERRADGITYYNKSRLVDQPLVATISTDGKWIVASFSKTTGNVWSNPELTCQHVDPQASLAPGQEAIWEVKILVVSDSLDGVLKKVIAQRGGLK
jgi:hypothetical protein